jgi:hypothetical protein
MTSDLHPRGTSSWAAVWTLVGRVPRFFFLARPADGDDADGFMAVCNERGPRRVADSPNDLKPRFVRGLAGASPVRIRPERLSLNKVDPVFDLVRSRLRDVELELHEV